MTESLGMIVKLIDHFGFLCEDYALDLTSYHFDRKSFGNINAVFENKELALRFTLEKGQLFIHASPLAYPEEWYSVLKLVKYIARKGGTLSAEEQNTDYWRNGQQLESQYALAVGQLHRILGTVINMLGSRELETTRLDLRSFARPTPSPSQP